MQEHIHSAESPGLRVELLAIDSHLATGYFFIGFQQQAAAAAGGIVDSVVLLGLNKRGHQFRDLAWREEFASLLPGIRGEHSNHVLVGISDDIGGTQLTGTQIQTVEILQQVAQGSVLLFWFTEVYLGVEVDSPEYIAQLSAVVFLDVVQCHIDFLADFSIVPVGIEIVEGGLLVHCKAFPAHGPFHPAHIPVILFDIPFASLFGNIAEVLYEQHGEDIVFIAGTVDLATETITGVPQDLFNIFSGCHLHFPFFALLYA